MTRREPQEPPEHTLRRLTGTRLLGGTTSAAGETNQARPVPPLLPARARRPAGIAVACCAVLVAVLGALAAHRAQGNAVDRPVDSWIQQHLASHQNLLSDIAYLGGGQMAAVLTAVLVLACLAARRVNGAVLVLVSVVVTAGLTEYVLKPLVHESIGGSLTYPSGHMASLSALFGAAGVLMLDPPRWRPRPGVRLLLTIGLVVVGCIVAIALVGLNYHYFTDTIAGVAWGTCVVLTATFLLDGAGARRWLGAARLRWRRVS
jgi:membrane-associated phospholipid phosphatase